MFRFVKLNRNVSLQPGSTLNLCPFWLLVEVTVCVPHAPILLYGLVSWADYVYLDLKLIIQMPLQGSRHPSVSLIKLHSHLPTQPSMETPFYLFIIVQNIPSSLFCHVPRRSPDLDSLDALWSYDSHDVPQQFSQTGRLGASWEMLSSHMS